MPSTTPSAQACSAAKSLKSATAELHARLETRMGSAVQHPTPASYRSLLETMYGFYRPLEPLIGADEALRQRLPDYWERTKIPSIERDLLALGCPSEGLSQIPCCDDLPGLSSTARRFGCLYVLEGATLGGQFISRSLSQSLGVDASNGGSFYIGYGDETSRRWRVFREALDAYAGELTATLPLIKAARETFLSLEKWWIEREPQHAV